ncbi:MULTISPECIES: sigma-54 interaction domain-containing protein [Acidithiobacillus]|jgi:PAS domain S-box-containing protein|uniref:PAS modulated sigma54 specific transcriptional regulator, Fis family n=3 Tax=Acidithiobacillus caldus TaxID=33059 RepID=F9ZLV4_ACICS|nr:MULTISPECIES: sigma-54-dependent Fis family transcriptional regulator [Acidithiobacillus]AEK57436.1 PAS modulated sigma54 specific transcriptional regulator, Fis family [Acidithiobacillus caldus SM-1]AIA54650.1 Response regulator of zinc sigma-54-dependent two-component system [Acidithiobacillus caldus ATCC 51756]AUW32154.1 sigma-54-dependent Fis family transcriptional regulator [Acidithiobacillus caldus]MBU2728965.1 sigma-54-dependent Fis family transcriptional regulator [Acidithiobacillus 
MTDLDSKTRDVLLAVMPQLIDNIPFGMMIADQQGNILYFNSVADQFLGINRATHLREIPHLQLQKEIVRASISAGHGDAVSRPAESCVSWDRVVTNDNETRILALRTRMVRQRDRKYRVFFIEDVTTLRQAERSLSGESRAGIHSRDPQMLRAIELIEQVAQSDASVLIQGESGTGKGMLARLLHDSSLRARKPLVEVNCAAIPENLWEAEFFGAAKGAYTGAVGDRIGRFAAADGGTLFLDEISELSKPHQAKLLKVLEEQSFEPIGSMKTRKVDVRVVAATNQGLKAAVERGDFRADLFYRLNVIPVHVPPLRERRSDIILLAEYFLAKFGGRNARKLGSQVKHLLLDYPWPGNVRELRNIMEYTSICATGNEVELADLPQDFVERVQKNQIGQGQASAGPLDEERDALINLLQKHANNRSAVARELGIDRVTLWRRMTRLGLSNVSEV